MYRGWQAQVKASLGSGLVCQVARASRPWNPRARCACHSPASRPWNPRARCACHSPGVPPVKSTRKMRVPPQT